MRNSVKYSQNFIIKTDLVQKIIDLSSINNKDTVIEIGGGIGIITSVLSVRAKKVITYEIDSKLYDTLHRRFKNTNVKIIRNNFLMTQLPDFTYKVFSNIPFNISSSIIKKLFLFDKSPSDTFLILQNEAALKFLGKPYSSQNSLISVLMHPWFESNILYKFSSNDFYPKPNVKIVLVNMKKRQIPLVTNREGYYDFVTYLFNQYKPKLPHGATQTEISFNEWRILFDKRSEETNTNMKGSFNMLTRQQENIEKIHRTRLDKNWKSFK